MAGRAWPVGYRIHTTWGDRDGQESNAPGVITRIDKRLKNGWHLAAFVLTGGASAPVITAAITTTGTATSNRVKAASVAVTGQVRWMIANRRGRNK